MYYLQGSHNSLFCPLLHHRQCDNVCLCMQRTHNFSLSLQWDHSTGESSGTLSKCSSLRGALRDLRQCTQKSQGDLPRSASTPAQLERSCVQGLGKQTLARLKEPGKGPACLLSAQVTTAILSGSPEDVICQFRASVLGSETQLGNNVKQW